MKKLLSLILACCLFICMTLTAKAETVPTPSIEDILNEYHSRVFEASSGNVSAYARSGMTLEQETVERLTAAGYEAYNITADNYDMLQVTLKTDFAEMGLDRDNSYIIVFSGEEDDGADAHQPQPASVPLPDFQDPGGNESGGFLYYYEPYDRYYRMRYATVVFPVVTGETVNIVSTFGSAYTNSIANSNIIGFIDSNSIYTTGSELGGLRDRFSLSASYTYSVPSLSLQSSVIWTRHYLDIFDEQLDIWEHTTYSEYATVEAAFTGHYFNDQMHITQSVNYSTRTIIYAPNFSYIYPEEMKITAIHYQTGYPQIAYRTHEIQIYTVDASNAKTILVTIYEGF